MLDGGADGTHPIPYDSALYLSITFGLETAFALVLDAAKKLLEIVPAPKEHLLLQKC